jgi:hypothetical protein
MPQFIETLLANVGAFTNLLVGYYTIIIIVLISEEVLNF